MTVATLLTKLSGPSLATGPAALRHDCAVRLIDRRTGTARRVNGSPLVLFSRDPAEAVAELLDGQDATVWEASAESIWGPIGRRT